MTMRTHHPPLPTFIIIGAQKSATRWLRYNLGLHPDVFTARQEVKFFNHPKRMQALGLDWYRDQFSGWDGQPITGEATPGYMILRHGPDAVAERMQQTVPDVRLIALLRNPVDRANSALLHHIRQERVHPSTRLIDLVRRRAPEHEWMAIVSGGLYAASLEPFLRRFDQQLLVLLHDGIAADPRPVFQRALLHVGASEAFLPPSANTAVDRHEPDRVHVVSSEERLEIFELFREDVDRLEQMFDLDLSIWKPGAVTARAPIAAGE
jgi:Sulfotransferase domain